MTEIDIKELMVDDWVVIHEHLIRPMPGQIKPEHFLRSLCVFYPIPLTTEILKESGFMNDGGDKWTFSRVAGDGSVTVNVTDMLDGLWDLEVIVIDKSREEKRCAKLENVFLKVHEMQHVLHDTDAGVKMKVI